MSEQLSLFEAPPVLPLRYRLLFAIFPDAPAVESILNHQAGLSKELGLKGKPRPREILHVTLHHIDDYPEIPERVVASAIEACTSALAGRPSFEVTFTQAKSFKGRPGNRPFVLVNPEGNPALMELHRSLIMELAKHRLASRGDFNYEPHVTMLYDQRLVPEQSVSPVTWKVKEVAFILSHLGATKYERLGHWDLP